MKNTNIQDFKQKLFRIHTSLGIIVSLLLYISIFFGIFAIFVPYLHTWEKPSRYIQSVDMTKIDYKPIIDEILKDPNYSKNNILISLSGTRNDPAIKVVHRFVEPLYFNPHTSKKLNDEQKASHLSEFLNELHYGKPLDIEIFGTISKYFGRTLFGLNAVASLILIISGVMLIIYLKFKNKASTPKSYFSKMHIKTLTWLFPILFLLCLSGAFMNIGLLSTAPMAKMLTNDKTATIDKIVGPALFPRNPAPKKVNINTSMMPIGELLQIAKEINPKLLFKEISLINWYDKTAKIEIHGYNPSLPFLNGTYFNKPKIVLNAQNGKLLENIKVLDRSWGAFLAESIYYLHILLYNDIYLRVIIALLMAVCAIGIFFGVMIFLEKKAKRFKDKIPFYHWMEKLSLSIILGVLPATGMLFILQWLLPFDLKDRVLWQQGIFFNVWLFTLFWSFFRVNTYQAAKEFLTLGGVFFVFTPFIHYISLNMSPIYLYKSALYSILGVDICLFIFGILLVFISYKIPKDRKSAKLFWIKKDK